MVIIVEIPFPRWGTRTKQLLVGNWSYYSSKIYAQKGIICYKKKKNGSFGISRQHVSTAAVLTPLKASSTIRNPHSPLVIGEISSYLFGVIGPNRADALSGLSAPAVIMLSMEESGPHGCIMVILPSFGLVVVVVTMDAVRQLKEEPTAAMGKGAKVVWILGSCGSLGDGGLSHSAGGIEAALMDDSDAFPIRVSASSSVSL